MLVLPQLTIAGTLPRISTASIADFISNPITSVESATPLVMLTLSRDHQLHYKAYSDYSDLDGDGVLETGYAGSIDYYGYFDAKKCYSYINPNTALGRYAPTGNAVIAANNAKACNQGGNSGQWSGNFLNWVSMTRMDAVRKLLYGGLRATDTTTTTVLERSYLPTDAHAFAKYYQGADIASLTPFADLATTVSSSTIGAAISSTAEPYLRISNAAMAQPAGSATVTVTTSSAHRYAENAVVHISGSGIADWDGFRKVARILSSTQFTFTTAISGSARSFGPGQAGNRMVIPLQASAAYPVAVGDQLKLTRDADNFMYVVVTSLVDAGNVAGSSFTSGTVYAVVETAGINRVVGSGSSGSIVLTRLNTVGLSFCNLTRGTLANDAAATRLSQTNTNPPLLRVARGNFALWGANERYQCYWGDETGVPGDRIPYNLQGDFGGGLRSNGNRAGWSGIDAAAENPLQAVHALAGNGQSNGEFIVRVEACKQGLDSSERCKTYPQKNTTYPEGIKKPIGLLQIYGEEGRIDFGLVTTSYQKNISGGVLRKNAASFSDEITAATGIFSGSSGIVSNLSQLKIYGYDYRDGGYYNADHCTFQLAGLVSSGGVNVQGAAQNEGNCTSWGNPIAEAYVETLRYLAGLAADTRYTYPSSGSKDASLGLTVVSTRSDPLNEDNYCASLNVIAFNASVSSYDNDQADSYSGLAGSPDLLAETKEVGDNESITGRNWFVGNAGGANNDLCDAKAVVNLASVSGLCPEAGGLKGSFLSAGAAFHSHTHRIRSTLKNAAGSADKSVGSILTAADTRSLKVDTYSIQLATNTPKIVVPVPHSVSGQKVTILPLYRLDPSSNGSGPYGGGAIVDFRVVSQDLVAGTGKFYVNWEDSAQGGDYDQDLWGTISYAFSGNTITITTDAIANATANGQGFGYIISGTTQDGPHFHSGIYGFDYVDPSSVAVRLADGSEANNNVYINASGGCRDCDVADPPTSVTYTLGSSPAGVLQDPLYYAAKYGGFDDHDGDGRPGAAAEWDVRKADGSKGSDGLPDHYFLVSNPAALESALQTTFSAILAKVAAGGAAAVVASAREGEGVIYQALFEPSRSDDSGLEVKWLGTLQALWIDALGQLREDNGNRRLDEASYALDPVIETYFDAADRVPRFRRYAGDPATTAATIHPLHELKTLWNARERLSELTSTDLQRDYATATTIGRHVFTYVDLNLDGQVTAADTGREVLEFTGGEFADGLYGMLNTDDAVAAGDLVNFIRGRDIAGLRNRTLDYDGDGSVETLRLGDIVQSTPTVVGTPAEAYDLLYGDSSYAAFREKYRRRRSVVYVGANDGMLHAFNAGFYSAGDKGYALSGVHAEAPHALGAELWAYVPYNLLPHLGWLASPDYAHVWYQDGKPRVFDARIFTADADHPGGWGTVLVAGMRFGGGPIRLPTTGHPNSAAAFSRIALGGRTELAFRSAYVVMDITNPEKPPTLLAEINDSQMGYTTGYPTAVAVSRAEAGALSDSWHLIFGNGPQNLPAGPATTAATSSSNAKLYVYDLKARNFVSDHAPLDLGSDTVTSFVGDPVAVDWDMDFSARDASPRKGGTDAVYFGIAGGSTAVPTGKLYKLDVREESSPSNWAAPVVLLDPAKPLLTTPAVTLDRQGRRWVLAGTGRYSAPADKKSKAAQALFGTIDALGNTPPVHRPYSGLVDVTNARVSTGGVVEGIAGATTFSGLEALTSASGGWKLELDASGVSAERNLSQTALLDQMLFATGFTPSTSLCGGEGASRLFGLYFKTGTARPDLPMFGIDVVNNFTTVSGSVEEARRSLNLGAGLGASPGLHVGGPLRDSRGLTILSQSSTGIISRETGNISLGARSGEIDWRESEP